MIKSVSGVFETQNSYGEFCPKGADNMRYQENSLRIFPNFPMRKTFDNANIKSNSKGGSK